MLKLFFYFSLLLSSLFADNTIIIDKQYFSIVYSPFHKGAVQVSYSLTKDTLDSNIKQRGHFYTESSLDSSIATNEDDYTNTGFDRGHLAPDASFDWSIPSRDATYSMANIVPQYPVVNQKVWASIENLERYSLSQFGSISVINIVDYSNFSILHKEPIQDTVDAFLSHNSFKNEQHKFNFIKKKEKASLYLDQKQIHVPSGFYKIISNSEHHFKECFYVPNKPDLSDFNPKSYQISCSSLNI